MRRHQSYFRGRSRFPWLLIVFICICNVILVLSTESDSIKGNQGTLPEITIVSESDPIPPIKDEKQSSKTPPKPSSKPSEIQPKAKVEPALDPEAVPQIAETRGDQLVSSALSKLRELDKKHPQWHHAGSRYFKSEFHASRSSSLAFWGWDLGVPEWLGWLQESKPKQKPMQEMRKYKATVTEAISLLKESWELEENIDAGYLLAQIALFGNYSTPMSPKTSFQLFHRIADKTGNATAHYYLGLFYSTNLGEVLGPGMNSTRQDRAQLHYTLASFGGHIGAEMTMGYRYEVGIGTGSSCKKSCAYYHRVARKILKYYYSGPIGGFAKPGPKIQLSTEDGGIFGPASVLINKDVLKSDPALTEEDVFEYYRFMADKGDINSQWMLGRTFYEGTPTITQNYNRALRYLVSAAGAKITTGSETDSYTIAQRKTIAGRASGIVGKMYLRGEGVTPNNATATDWFKTGAALGDSVSLAWLGIMEVDQYYLKLSKDPANPPPYSDLNNAMGHLREAAKMNDPEAQTYLALMYLDEGGCADSEAFSLLQKAARSKHLPAMFHLAEMFYNGQGGFTSCTMANGFLRVVVEYGIEWFIPHMSTAYNVLADPNSMNTELSLILYLMAGESGIDIAQSNLSWLLDQRPQHPHPHATNSHTSSSSVLNLLFPNSKPSSHGKEAQSNELSVIFPTIADQIALTFWNRAANQNNPDARVKVGDYFYYGIGVNQSYEQALIYYEAAATQEKHGIALWNLGYMYHHGLGVKRDFHLAKRYYDQSLKENGDAWLPVSLSRIYLNFSMFIAHVEDTFMKYFGSLRATPSASSSDISQTENGVPQLPQDLKADDKVWSWREFKKVSRTNSGTAGGGTRRSFFSRMLSSVWSGGEDVESIFILVLLVSLAYLVYVRQLQYNNPRPGPPPAVDPNPPTNPTNPNPGPPQGPESRPSPPDEVPPSSASDPPEDTSPRQPDVAPSNLD